MPMMVGMMVCAVVVVCPAEAHNIIRRFSREVSYTRPCRRMSNKTINNKTINRCWFSFNRQHAS
jgi:hypothetical protein